MKWDEHRRHFYFAIVLGRTCHLHLTFRRFISHFTYGWYFGNQLASEECLANTVSEDYEHTLLAIIWSFDGQCACTFASCCKRKLLNLSTIDLLIIILRHSNECRIFFLLLLLFLFLLPTVDKRCFLRFIRWFASEQRWLPSREQIALFAKQAWTLFG